MQKPQLYNKPFLVYFTNGFMAFVTFRGNMLYDNVDHQHFVHKCILMSLKCLPQP